MKEEISKRCGVCQIPCFERNNFFYGKLMTVRDFSAEQCYFNEKRWLINRMVHGWGVVCGLDVVAVKDNPTKVTVTTGLAIDCCGREVLVCEEQGVELVPGPSDCHTKKGEDNGEKKLYICIDYRECKTEPVQLPPVSCDKKEKGEFNRIRDSFIISVRRPDEVCIPDDCPKYCPLSENKSSPLREYLCGKLKAGCPECLEKCCVILAEVTITPATDATQPPTVVIDACSKRQLVYGNAMLFELIRCFHGDLPHVTAINWKSNGATIDWNDFKNGIYKDGLKVWFDKKMDASTINVNTFLVMVKMEDSDTGNSTYDMIPGDVSYQYDEGTKSSVATFLITSKWLIDVFLGYSRVRDKGGEFLVILKGDFIMSVGDACIPAKALDGNFIGGSLPSGNGTPGGDFESWFYLGPETA
ncbi:MAG TPA: hypothetical protein VK448_07140 [Dissulfurispiraceae bacterium]|nr:hypothetical protein [Dissulfurispiraceae bacterium]